jgi:hypothetical protein
MELITERQIIELRDTMEVSKLSAITKKCEKQFGFVDYRHIFKAMGYVHAFNDKWYKPKTF